MGLVQGPMCKQPSPLFSLGASLYLKYTHVEEITFLANVRIYHLKRLVQ
jgi:hypothetical protein